MVTVSTPLPQISSTMETEEVSPAKMNGLLEELKTKMVELILQGDDVTRQMWHMYSVFEELFGRQTMTTSSDRPLKHVVVGDRLHNKKPSPPPPAAATTTTITPVVTSSPSASSVTTSTVKDTKTTSSVEAPVPASPQNKQQQPNPSSPSQPVPSSDSSSPLSGVVQPRGAPHQPCSPSNPLLATIGAIGAAPDSDDSDLDVVYHQLRHRGRQQRRPPPEQPPRPPRHQQVANSDPESLVGYAGSNSVDSGYKSLCATPEVSDALRRSASDVSASDSSSSHDKAAKIRMGTRSIRSHAMSDVTLDHLMYLRQSLRKDRSEASRSPIESLPSSATSSTFRDSDLSPRSSTLDEDWGAAPPRAPPFHPPPSFSRTTQHHHHQVELVEEGGGESSSDFLLSGVEYYDLESVHEFPNTNNYVTMLEEKTRCARFKLVSTPKSSEPLTERQLSSLYRRRSESVDGRILDAHRHHPPPPPQQHHQPRRHHHPPPPHPHYAPHHHPPPPQQQQQQQRHPKYHHRPRPHHSTDSRLTEAAIRVLEMIEDFRMEEALSSSSSSRVRYRPASVAASAEHHVYEEILYDLVPSAGQSGRLLPQAPPPQRQPLHKPYLEWRVRRGGGGRLPPDFPL